MQLLKAITQLRIHCSASKADSAWLKKYGKLIKAAGGKYSTIRGDLSSKRFVYMPVTPDNHAFITELAVTGHGGKLTFVVEGVSHRIIMRDTAAPMRDLPAWGRVHHIDPLKEMVRWCGPNDSVIQTLEVAVEKALQRLWAEDQATPMGAPRGLAATRTGWGAQRFALESDRDEILAVIKVQQIANLKRTIADTEASLIADKARLAQLEWESLAADMGIAGAIAD